MYDCVIFDLDGTLINSSKGIINATVDALSEIGLNSLDYDTIESCIGPPIGDKMSELMGYTLEEKNKFECLFKKYYGDKYLFDAELYPGIKELLIKLKSCGIILCIATNKREYHTMRLLDAFGLSQFFNTIVCRDDGGKYSKKDLIDLCIDETRTHSKKIVMIGDTMNDLVSAHACNVDFIAVTYGYGFKDKSELTCQNTSDIGHLFSLILA